MTSLEQTGPHNTSGNLLHAYYKFALPPQPPRNQSPDPETVILSKGKGAEAYRDFRKFAKTAARSCVRMSSQGLSIEDVQAEYTSILESLDGLRDFMRTLPYKDWEWLGPS